MKKAQFLDPFVFTAGCPLQVVPSIVSFLLGDSVIHLCDPVLTIVLEQRHREDVTSGPTDFMLIEET